MIVSVHIPKTGGTGITNQIRSGAFGKFLLDYDDKPRSRLVSRKIRRLWSRLTVPFRAADLRSFNIIHGHFPATKYRSVGDAFMVFLRDPVQRTLSHFHYLKKRAEKWDVARRKPQLMQAITEENMDLVEFAALQQDYYRSFIGDMPFEQFDVVGLTEEYEQSIALLNKRFNVTLLPLRERYLEHPREHLPEVARLNAENYHYYELARRRHIQLVRELLGQSG